MIDRLGLENFKCFSSLVLPLAPLTLLSGTNSGGKSSVIQALALLAHNLEMREWEDSLLLNGPDLALGRVADVLNQQSGGRHLKISCASDDEKIEWTFLTEDRKSMSMGLAEVVVEEGQHRRRTEMVFADRKRDRVRWLLPADADIATRSKVVASLKRVTWLTAERVGPREVLPLRDPGQHRRVGVRGEYAAGLLHWSEFDEVVSSLCVEGEPKLLLHQVRAHMRRFFPSFDLRVTPIEGASALTLKLRTNPRDDFHRPQNVGFGLIQLLPVVVALIHAQPGDMLMIENPEVHLHPRAQQDIGMLMCEAAAAGVQVVVESHSDHLLNGIRLAVKDSVLSARDVALHFFSSDATRGDPISPSIDDEGRLDSWPSGFFDQFDDALARLL